MDSKQIIMQKIADTAAERADGIISDAQKECDTQRERTQAEIAARRQKAFAAAQYDCEKIRGRVLVASSLENKKNGLKVKRDALEKAFSAAVNNIFADDKQYKQFMAQLLKKYAQKGDEVQICAADKDRLDARWLKEAAGELNLTLAAGYHGDTGGFVIRSAECDKRVTLTSLLDETREKCEIEAARLLFGK